ncbi:lysostaphin resistance A-like protein [Ekhidna sp.]
MKNLWNKFPAWLKATLQGVVLLLPIILFNQILVFNNLTSGHSIPWALPVVIIALFIYWKIVNRFDANKQENDIKIDLKLELSKSTSWYQILGLIFLTYSAIALVYMFFPIEGTPQQQMLLMFREAEPLIAISLLLALALHAGVVEEIAYRGFMQNTLQHKYSRITSYLIIGILFAISHFLPFELIVPYLLVSMAISYVADMRKSIGLNIFSHFLVDAILFIGAYFGIINLASFNWMNFTINIILLVLGVIFIFGKKNLSQKLNSPIG